MDNSPTIPKGTNDQTIDALTDSLKGLRTLFHVLVLAMIVLSGSIVVYFWKQTGIVRRQVAEMDTYVSKYNAETRPKMEEFVNRLQQFSKTNPDFKPVLDKYFGGAPSQPAPAAQAGGAPAPASPAR